MDKLFDLPALTALADNYITSAVTLSPMSVVLIYAVSGILEDHDLWTGADGFELSTAEQDEVDAMIAKLMSELQDATAS